MYHALVAFSQGGASGRENSMAACGLQTILDQALCFVVQQVRQFGVPPVWVPLLCPQTDRGCIWLHCVNLADHRTVSGTETPVQPGLRHELCIAASGAGCASWRLLIDGCGAFWSDEAFQDAEGLLHDPPPPRYQPVEPPADSMKSRCTGTGSAARRCYPSIRAPTFRSVLSQSTRSSTAVMKKSIGLSLNRTS